MFHQNVSKFLLVHSASHARRPKSSLLQYFFLYFHTCTMTCVIKKCTLSQYSSLYLDYKEELELRTQFASQHRRVLHEDLLTQPKRRKKEERKKGRAADTCNDRGKLQIHDEWKQENHNNKDKTKKNKKKHHKEHKKRKKERLVKNH